MLFVADRPKNAGIKILSKTNRTSEPGLYPDPVFLPGSGSGSGFGSGSGSRFQIYLDPDPVFKFLWIRIQIRFSNFSGSGFLISLDTDLVSDPGSLGKKKSAERAQKLFNRRKNEKGKNFPPKIIIKQLENCRDKRCLDPDPVCPERLDPDPVCFERLDPNPDQVCLRLNPDPDPVNIRPDPKPWFEECIAILQLISDLLYCVPS